MPLAIAPLGQELKITHHNLTGEIKQRMENLGILPGERVVVMSEKGGDVIIRVKESRLAVNKGLALQIFAVLNCTQ